MILEARYVINLPLIFIRLRCVSLLLRPSWAAEVGRFEGTLIESHTSVHPTAPCLPSAHRIIQ